jgi:hypothetical protein
VSGKSLVVPGLVAALAALTASPAGAAPQSPGIVPADFHGARPSFAWRTDGRARRRVAFPTPIQHVVVIVMENRSVDNLFAGYFKQQFNSRETWGQALDLYDPSNIPTLFPWPLEAPFDPHHGHKYGYKIEAAGNWGNEIFGCHVTCPPGRTAYAYVPTTEVDPYAKLITNFAFAREVFQPSEGPSFPAHQYLIAGQAGGANTPGAPLAIGENPNNTTDGPVGDFVEETGSDMAAPPGFCTTGVLGVMAIDTSQSYSQNESKNARIEPPCVEYPTILDEMVTRFGGQDYYDWQFVAHSPMSIWAAPMVVKHLAQAYDKSQNKRTQPFAIDGNAVQFVTDIKSQTPTRPFANLTYITPCMNQSDHPNFTNGSDGPKFVAYVVNAIGQSKYWQNTTIFVVWDDWGGWFDHVRLFPWPFHPTLNAYHNNPSDPGEWGFRVPLIAISPYVASRGFISRPNRSYSAILKYVEATFGLPSLRTDDYYLNDDLRDAFSFLHGPLPYVPVDIGSYTPPSAC